MLDRRGILVCLANQFFASLGSPRNHKPPQNTDSHPCTRPGWSRSLTEWSRSLSEYFQGLCGIVKRISIKGHAIIHFKGMDKWQGVLKQDFHKLRHWHFRRRAEKKKRQQDHHFNLLFEYCESCMRYRYNWISTIVGTNGTYTILKNVAFVTLWLKKKEWSDVHVRVPLGTYCE